MTAQQPFPCLSGGQRAVRSFHFVEFGMRWCARSSMSLCRQIIGNDAEADRASGAVGAPIPTTPQAMPTFDHPDAPFAADTPALPAAKPSLPFECPSRGRLASRSRQDYLLQPGLHRRLFVFGRRKAAIARRKIRRPTDSTPYGRSKGAKKSRIAR
jgi:hypothetical protein